MPAGIDVNTSWFEFMELANPIVRKGQKLDSFHPNIQMVYKRSFNNHVSFQIQWNEMKVKWFRTTWLKLTDAPDFYNPIERLKFISQGIQLTFQ